MRLARKLTQKTVADTVGMSQELLSKIEKGQRKITDENKAKLVAIYESITINQHLEAKFDWFRVRFPTNNVEVIIRDVLKMDFAYFMRRDTSLHGYKEMYYVDMIKILNSKRGDERGVLLELSGQGCRNYESMLDELNESWYDFVGRCFQFDGQATRLDVALDDKKGIIDLQELNQRIENELYDTRFKKYRYFNGKSLQSKENEGASLYFGTRQSLVHFCFYQKNYEIANKQNKPLEEIEEKNRYEIRLADKKARMFLEAFNKRQCFGRLILAIVAKQLEVYELKNGQLRLWRDWLAFIEGSSTIDLRMSPVKPSYRRKLSWVESYCARSIKIVKVVGEILGVNTLEEILEKTELTEEDEKLIEIAIAEECNFLDEWSEQDERE